MSAHGVIHILDSASGKARPLKLTSDKLGVNDATAQASLSNIENFISGTLLVEDSVSQISLNNIDNSLTGTLNVQDSNAQSSLSNIDSSLSSTLNVQDSVSQNSLFNIETYLGGTLTTTAAVTKSATQIANVQSVISGDFSTSSHNCSSERELVIVGTTTDMSNNIDIWVSNDNLTFYKYGNQSMFPDSSGNFGVALDCPFKYIKVKFNGAAAVTALVMGSN